ncbi:TatD family hydrolase [Mariniblastus fucicola]|uniref:Putative deoxyribonuclease YcfH n=1 Tax=Mariniblastus fucicola TaxID=980251 RepID=A0A5B9P3H5_9BACT|nr:TatD family hydrolase [Mariniblastus fucicola]QEG21127.1 putative deoxyribonuclease YcfH [Mariniblastus fucicola]
MPLFDTHAHLDSEQIHPHLDEILKKVDEEAMRITAIGTDPKSSHRCLELAKSHDNIFAAAGLHPNYCAKFEDSHWQAILEIVDHPKVVAIGETGLDKYWDDCPFDVQQKWFERHVDLSFRKNKPLVIHTRECEIEMIETLERLARDNRIIGIMHSFVGSEDTAKRCLDLGMYISFAGMVTFKKSAALREVAKTIPDDRILIETDSPYLSPHPLRSKRPNVPMYVEHTANCLAEVRGVSVEELVTQTFANANRVFNLEDTQK